MAKRFKPEYTADDVLALWKMRSAEGDEARLRDLATQFRSLCRLENKVSIPKQYKSITKEVRTPFVRDAHHRITSSLIAKRPLVHIIPKDEQNKEYRDAANTGERWDMAMVERQSKDLGIDLNYELAAGHVRDGESVLKVVHRPDAWANFPKRLSDEEDAGSLKKRQDEFKRGIDLPIAWRPVDRLTVLYEGGEYGDEWVMEYGEYPTPYLKSKYSMAEINKRLVNPKSTLEGKPLPEGLQSRSTGYKTKIEFLTPDEWHVVIDGTEAPGYPKANPYSPYLNYFRAPAYNMESLLYSLLFLVPRLDELLTMKLNHGTIAAYPTPIIKTVPNTSSFPGLDGPIGNAGDVTQGKEQKLTWSPGKLMELPVGKEIYYLEPPAAGKDLNDLVQIFKSMIDIAGIPSIMRGVASSGESGYLGRQLRDAADMAYKLSVISLQRQQEKAFEFSHWLVENRIKQTVYVLGWESINPKTGKPKDRTHSWLGLTDSEGTESKNVAKVNKLGPVEVQYRPAPPTDQQAAAMIALQLTNAQKPLYGVRDALEKIMQEEDPESIMDQMWVEQQENENPLINQTVIDHALEDAGMKPPPAPNPANALVGPNGLPLMPPGPIPPGMQGVPLANQAPPGMPGIPGLTMPLSPPTPQGIPGNVGGRPAGAYPGLPSNQGAM